jgi:hypothetical protein
MMTKKSYSELVKLQTFKERLEYLKLNGYVGHETFGSNRWVNQQFYHSNKWRKFRDKIIIRDNGCDLGLEGYDIQDTILIHHLNPITCDDILEEKECVLNPDNVICVRLSTHNAIHYGNDALIDLIPIIRTKNDMCPWRS